MAAYAELHRAGGLRARAAEAVSRLCACRLCPRECGVDRLAGRQGFCRTGRHARVASFHPHFGEEAPLVGRFGSGTVFFCGCNLRCAFCQNYEISHGDTGQEVAPEVLAEIMLRLARRGCHNLNVVTPSHVVPQILEALAVAAERGLDLPLVYNSGGYDSVETLRLLEGVVDVYMPDFKFWDNRWAQTFCRAPDYRERATAAIREMHRQVGDLRLDAQGIAVRGLLVRHLVMPGGVAGSADVLRFLAGEISPETYVNVMAQYHPCGSAVGHELIGRLLTGPEFAAAVRAAREAGLTRLDR